MGDEPASVSLAQETFDEAQIERGRHLFAQACAFLLGANEAGQLPPSKIPEVAFIGRSNVGKSSLVNALTGRNALARTSNTPGRTRQINLFSLADRLYLADLPGYGYAVVPKHERERWPVLIESYLKGRPNLRRTALLVDSRHGLKDVDRSLMSVLDAAAVTYQIVLTKIDKVKSRREQIIQAVSDELIGHPAAFPTVWPTSAAQGDGIAELRAGLAALAAAP
ncbi:MAG: ribosome biogenesis GTP-binding protein YihA/YsxC [Proteobacteria bacterium]|nr:ribosome biogenesis GTP-binding protein YihA/YsxC [Pseudomonadota bacterium]